LLSGDCSIAVGLNLPRPNQDYPWSMSKAIDHLHTGVVASIGNSFKVRACRLNSNY
jgi:hypothetical protein